MKDRKIDRTDNQPPEALPVQLASVADLPAMMKADIDALTAEALAQLDTYSRVPAEIADDGVYQRATTLGTLLKAVLDKIEKRRKDVKQPYLDATTAIDAAFKLVQPKTGDMPERNLRKELDAAHSGIKSLLSAYDTKLFLAEEKRRAEEKAQLAAAAAKDGIEIDEQPAAGVVIASTKSSHGGAAVRRVVTEWEVVDADKLPRSVLSVDPAKVQAMIDAGATSIPGIAISKKVDTHVKRG